LKNFFVDDEITLAIVAAHGTRQFAAIGGYNLRHSVIVRINRADLDNRCACLRDIGIAWLTLCVTEALRRLENDSVGMSRLVDALACGLIHFLTICRSVRELPSHVNSLFNAVVSGNSSGRSICCRGHKRKRISPLQFTGTCCSLCDGRNDGAASQLKWRRFSWVWHAGF